MTTPPGVPCDPEARAALALLRSCTSATLLVDASPRAVRLIVEPLAGRLVLPMDPRDLDASEWILCLPDDSFDTRARLTLELEPLGEHDEAVDRFAAYHGRAPGPWAQARIAFAKLDSGPVIDGEHLMLANPLLASQTALCRRLNADADALRTACARSAGVAPEEPAAVGVDPLGMDVRARFGVVRVEFTEPLADADDAHRRLAAWLEGGVP